MFFSLASWWKKKKEEREYYCPLSSKRNIICARGARQLTWVCELTHFLTPGEVWVFQVSFPTSQSSVPSPLLSARRAWFSEHWMLTQVFQAKEHFKVLINIWKTKSTIFCRRKKSEKAWQGGQHGHFYPASKVQARYKQNFVEPRGAVTWSHHKKKKLIPLCSVNWCERALMFSWQKWRTSRKLTSKDVWHLKWSNAIACSRWNAAELSSLDKRLARQSSSPGSRDKLRCIAAQSKAFLQKLMHFSSFVTKRLGDKLYGNDTRWYKRPL